MKHAAHRTRTAVCVAAAGLFALSGTAHAAPYIWDDDGDRIDDRVESVHFLGYQFSFEGNDTLGRQRIAVVNQAGGLAYGVYVVFDHVPTSADFASLAAVGMPVLHRYDAVPAIRSLGTFVQIETAAALPGVERIEAIPVVHPMLREAAGAIGVRDATGGYTWESGGGGNGEGVVVAILDSGINDAPDGAYPGHESLAGKFLGGATFLNADSTLDTPRAGSVNPRDRGGALTQAHGTHVASIVLGTGGASGYATGVAPAARFVDVKVIGDAGVGTGVAEALDWCISNRGRDWGGPPGFDGIDVINLSLSSLDRSDGNDLPARLAARAAELGIVVVASMGNDGRADHVPSPAAADRVLAVGASDHQRSGSVGDDRFAEFANVGPRASDGDLEAGDEQKPDLVAPGVAVLAADGDLATDGAQYRRLSGTSMSAAFVSGAAAAALSSYPGLSPQALADLLRATAHRGLSGVPAGGAGADPRWHPAIGYGAIDLHALRIELEQPSRSQVLRLELSGAGDQIDAVLRTQREYLPARFEIERAPDAGGMPGTFEVYDFVDGTGDASLLDADNRGVYPRTWNVLPYDRGLTFWYRVAYEQDATRHVTAARPFTSPAGPAVATLEITLVHNALDHDVDAQVVIGAIESLTGGTVAHSGPLVIPVPATSASASSEWVTGASVTGNVAWTYRIGIPAGEVEACLPPSASCPWRLEVAEGGYLNRSGRITEFDLVWHSASGDLHYAGGPLPQQTVEGQTRRAYLPASLLSVGGPARVREASLAPNPVRAGQAIHFVTPAAAAGHVGIFDLGGREIGRAPLRAEGGGYRARWEARSGDGRPLAPGVYFVGVGSAPKARFIVLR